MTRSVSFLAERELISACVNNGQARMLMERGLRPEHMESDAHRKILKHIFAVLLAKGEVCAADVLTEAQTAGDALVADALSDACEVPCPQSIDTQVAYVRQCSMDRDVVRVGRAIVDRVTSNKLTSSAAAAAAIERLKSIVVSHSRIEEDDPNALADAAAQRVIEGPPPMIPTGFRDLDAHMGGWVPGELTFVAGASSMGKSAFAVSSADELDTLGIPSVIINAEMTAFQTIVRLICRRTQIPKRLIDRGPLDKNQHMAVMHEIEKMRAGGLRIFSRNSPTVLDVENIVARMVDEGAQVVFIDQLDLMNHLGEKGMRNDLAIRQTSKALANIAKRYKVPVVCLHQMNRSAAKAGTEPKMQDLRDSAVENDASNVLILHRPEYHLRDKTDEGQREYTKVVIAKGRDCGTGFVNLRFIGQCVRFEDWDGPPPN